MVFCSWHNSRNLQFVYIEVTLSRRGVEGLDGSQHNERRNSVDVFGTMNLTHFEQERELRSRRIYFIYCYVSPYAGGMKLKGMKMGKVVKGNKRKEVYTFGRT